MHVLTCGPVAEVPRKTLPKQFLVGSRSHVVIQRPELRGTHQQYFSTKNSQSLKTAATVKAFALSIDCLICY